MTRECERGFTLLEALAALALTALAIAGVAGSVAACLHVTARSQTKLLLAADAQNVLTDLRAATAYDPALLAALAGRSTSVRLTFSGAHGTRTVALDADVARPSLPGSYLATVTATAPDGTAVSQSVTLTQEAPAPGSRLR
jgi:type II secretory pathway pseudopilin PulG